MYWATDIEVYIRTYVSASSIHAYSIRAYGLYDDSRTSVSTNISSLHGANLVEFLLTINSVGNCGSV